jgi:hypothetical protein
MLADTSVADRHRFDAEPDLTFYFVADPDSDQILPQILLFWAQMALASLVAISGPKKDSIFRAHPLQWPSKWMLPTSKSFLPAPYKQQAH